jgi:DNA-binding transcriptional MerR regulator
MSTVEETVEDLADLYVLEKSARGHNKGYVERIRQRRARAVRRGVPKAAVARLLGVSVNTLDKWIERGRIKTTLDSKSGRKLIDGQEAARLLIAVRVLRAQGTKDGVLAAAIQQLERGDPKYQRDFADLYGASLASMEAGSVRPLRLPDAFGPED